MGHRNVSKANTMPFGQSPPLRNSTHLNKHLREMGLSYLRKDGTERSDRAPKPACRPQCIYECSMNFNSLERLRIHKQFWSLTHDQKKTFYRKLVERIPRKRVRVKHESKRTYTYLYHFELNSGKRLQVCTVFFLRTLDISNNTLIRFYKAEK